MSDEPNGLQIEAAAQGDGQIVRVRGEVDLRSSPQLRSRLLQIIEQKPKCVVVDLSGVSYMDSSGVGTMVEVKRLIERDGGQIVLSGLQPRVRSVFEITQLDKFFRIVDSVDEACNE